jgi:chemotaxis protein methyltransferase CheR
MSLLTSASGIIFGAKHHEFSFTPEDFRRISCLIHQRAGITLTPNKAEMVYGRLSRRLRVLKLNSFSVYLDLLTRGNEDEWGPFIDALTTHLTSFFPRDTTSPYCPSTRLKGARSPG